MANTLQFDLVSPERSMASGAATMVTAPGAEGDLGVLPGHAPFLATLRPGIVTADLEGGAQRYVVFGGFAEIGADHCVILADDVHAPDKVTAAMVAERIAAAEKAASDAPDADAIRLNQLAMDLKALRDLHLK